MAWNQGNGEDLLDRIANGFLPAWFKAMLPEFISHQFLHEKRILLSEVQMFEYIM